MGYPGLCIEDGLSLLGPKQVLPALCLMFYLVPKDVLFLKLATSKELLGNAKFSQSFLQMIPKRGTEDAC